MMRKCTFQWAHTTLRTLKGSMIYRYGYWFKVFPILKILNRINDKFENSMCLMLALILFLEKLYHKWQTHSSNVILGKMINDNVNLRHHNWSSARSNNIVGDSCQDRVLDRHYSLGVPTEHPRLRGNLWNEWAPAPAQYFVDVDSRSDSPTLSHMIWSIISLKSVAIM